MKKLAVRLVLCLLLIPVLLTGYGCGSKQEEDSTPVSKQPAPGDNLPTSTKGMTRPAGGVSKTDG